MVLLVAIWVTAIISLVLARNAEDILAGAMIITALILLDWWLRKLQ
jgi:hypothetical protein